MNEYYSDNILVLTIDEKLDIIEDIEGKTYVSYDELKIINALSYDQDVEVRARVAESIMDSNNDLAEEVLIRLVNDKDSLVRANACDSLCNNRSSKALELLKSKASKDKCSLVRGYATLALTDIVMNNDYDKQKFIDFFFDRLKKEKVVWVKICIYKALYLMGCNEFLNLILTELNNRAYRNRCLAANTLKDVVSDENFNVIKISLIERKKKERSFAVTSTIENILNNMPT